MSSSFFILVRRPASAPLVPPLAPTPTTQVPDVHHPLIYSLFHFGEHSGTSLFQLTSTLPKRRSSMPSMMGAMFRHINLLHIGNNDSTFRSCPTYL
ncbi:hypothetical protein Hypma_007352 [Hypsizygus marmoreus]|uniref:Uncharacterized protein n=1 Tax=Hypsizygus marmoreus TaxID=39966 RepID=A0A369JSK9_HYPMA|nr:hypothetical protein Hypma_007352 [Hypsizygus marmoreus]